MRIHIANESAKCLRSLIIPLFVISLYYFFQRRPGTAVLFLLTTGGSTIAYMYLKLWHMFELYVHVVRLKGTGKILDPRFEGVRLLFWDGTFAGSAKLSTSDLLQEEASKEPHDRHQHDTSPHEVDVGSRKYQAREGAVLMVKQTQPTDLESSMKSKKLSSASPIRCPSCGTEAGGHFCSNCGEKELTDEDYSMRRYLKEIVTAVTLLESKVFRSVWFVLSRPGHLSDEYFRGRRVRYMKPLQLFVFLNVVYYFSLTLFYATTFTTPLATQLHMNNYYPKYASIRVQQKLQKEHVSYEVLEAKYNQRTNVLSKTMVFLLIPIFAVLFYALFFKKRKYLVEHTVVATHFWCFNLLLLGVILPLATVVLVRLFKAMNLPAVYVTDDAVASSALQLCFGVYLFIMLRRCYGISKWYGALSASVIAWSFFHIVWLYRFFLFEATLSVV